MSLNCFVKSAESDEKTLFSPIKILKRNYLLSFQTSCLFKWPPELSQY